MATVGIVDDHLLLAETLGSELQRCGHEVAIIDLTDPTSIATSCLRAGCDLVLVDLQLGEVNGTSVIDAVSGSGTDVVVLTGLTDTVELAVALEAGALGVIPKSLAFGALIAHVEAALRGDPVHPGLNERAQWANELAARRCGEAESRAEFDRLTQREAIVLEHLLDGLAPADIASIEVVSIETIRSQIKSILNKLGVHTQVAAVARAHQAQWRRHG